MREVVLAIPEWEEDQNLEIAVRINGKKKTMTYRVEILKWEGTVPSSAEKVTTIQHKLSEYDKDWQLVQIGSPADNKISLLFREKRIDNQSRSAACPPGRKGLMFY